MTDQEIAAEVRQTGMAFCKALDAAGKAGLQIDVKFGASERAEGGGEPTKVTGWHSYTKLSRVM